MESKTPAPSWSAFESGMRKILSVSKEEMLRREAAYKKASDENPKKRGPKKMAKE